jgi:hypothetical protein
MKILEILFPPVMGPWVVDHASEHCEFEGIGKVREKRYRDAIERIRAEGDGDATPTAN